MLHQREEAFNAAVVKRGAEDALALHGAAKSRVAAV
jgi:hypothetical protein